MSQGIICIIGIIGFLRFYKFKPQDFSKMPHTKFSQARYYYLWAYFLMALGAGAPIILALGCQYYISYAYPSPTMENFSKIMVMGKRFSIICYVFYFSGLISFLVFHFSATSIDTERLLFYRMIGKRRN